MRASEDDKPEGATPKEMQGLGGQMNPGFKPQSAFQQPFPGPRALSEWQQTTAAPLPAQNEERNLRPGQEARLPAPPNNGAIRQVSGDTSPWHTPPITQDDFDTLGFNNSPKQSDDHHTDYFQNTAPAAGSMPRSAQPGSTYGAAADIRGNSSNLGGNQPDAMAPGTRTVTIQEVMDGRKKALEKWDAAKGKQPNTESTVKALENEERRLTADLKGLWADLHQNRAKIEQLEGIRLSLKMAGHGIDIAKENFPEGVDVPFDFVMEQSGLSPEMQIKNIDAEISERKKKTFQLQLEIGEAEGRLADAKAQTDMARAEQKKK